MKHIIENIDLLFPSKKKVKKSKKMKVIVELEVSNLLHFCHVHVSN